MPLKRSFAPDDQRTPRAGDRQLAELIAEIRTHCDDLERGIEDRDPESKTYRQRGAITAFDVIGLSRVGSRDGYPTSSGLDPTPGHSGEPCKECGGTGETPDGEVCDCDPGPPMHGDPVGELAAAGHQADPAKRAAGQILHRLRGARGDMRMAVDALSKAAPPSGSPAPDGCSSHARLGRWEPIHRNGRCSWCYDVLRMEGMDPPLGVLQAHDRGEKISVRRMAEAIKEAGGRPPKGKRRKAHVGR